MLLFYYVAKERKRLELEIQRLQSKLQTMPKENLILAKNGTSYKWYCTDGKHKAYVPKSDRSMMEQLAYKKYYMLRLKNLEREQRAIDFYLKHHDEEAYQKEQELLSNSEFQKLISKQFLPKEQKMIEWMKGPFKKNEFHPEKLVHKTSVGIRVRSKSEQIIAMVLAKYQIPFRYECALEIGGKVYYPDFTILHPLTGEVFYWEHFGRMDDESYCEDMLTKLQNYIANDIVPNINLIVTFENGEHPLCEAMVEMLVKYYFL